MPLMPPFPNNRAGDMPSASALNQMQEALRLGASITGDASTGVRQSASGMQVFDASAKPFYAKITSGTNPYAWSEVLESLGVFVAYAEGRTGTAVSTNWPAYEINGATGVTAGTYGRFWKASDGDYYWFEQIGGGSGTSLVVSDGITIIGGVTDIEFVSGATVSSGGAGIANVAINTLTPNLTGGTGSATGSTFNKLLGSLTLPAGTYLLLANINFASGSTVLVNDAYELVLNIDNSTNVIAGQGYSQGSIINHGSFFAMSVATIAAAGGSTTYNLNFNGQLFSGGSPGTFTYDWSFVSLKVA